MLNQPYSFLVKKITATRTKESAIILLSKILLLFACSIFAMLAVAFIEFFAEGDTAFRTFLNASVMAVSLAAFVVFVIPSILRFIGIKGLPTINEIALRIGNYYPNIKDKLGNAVQLVANSENAVGSSKTLITAEIEAVYHETKNTNFDVIISKKYKQIIYLCFLVTSFSGFILNFNDGISEALFRIQNYSQSFLPPAPFTITLLTNEQTLLRGAKTEIVISATGQAPDYIKLHLKEDNQQNYDEFRLKRDGENHYKFEIASVKQNISFYGEATWLTSSIVTNIGKINVVDRPIIRSLAGKLRFPDYTKLAPKDINEQSADIAALVGSSAEFTITANKKLKNAYIIFEKSVVELNDVTSKKAADTFRIPLKINDNKAFGNFRISQNGFYYFVIEDFDGEKNINPIKYSVVALSDGAPSISLLFPTTDVQVTEQAILPIKVAISDDYGFSNLKLHYRLIGSRYSTPDKNFNSISIPINSNEQVLEIAYVWNLNKINIVPEDIYEFYLEVADNNSTPQKARTQMLKVRLPSLEEVSREVDVSQNKISKELESVKKEAEQITRNIEELERELRKKTNDKELNWKEKKQIQDILQKQSQVQDKMQHLSEQVQQTTEQLQQNNMLSAETMQKYQELQKLMQEVRSPQLDNLRKMQEKLLENMSPDELRKAMEQAKFDEERFKATIERTTEVLKRIQAEQKTDALTKRAEALKQKQDEINKELNKTKPNDKNKLNELAKKQENLQDELKNISKDLKDLEKLMQDIGEDMPLQEMKEAMDALDNQGISEDMENSANEMQSGEKNKADKSQKSASKKMDNFSQKMRDMKQEMQNKNSKEVVRKLQRAIDNLSNISKQQENTKNKTQKSDINSTRVPDIAEEQADIFENLYNLARDLNEIGSKSFAITQEMANDINDAARQMPNIMDQLTERRMPNAAKMQTDAMKKMNSALAQMQQSLGEMQNEGSCENGDGSGSGSGQGKGKNQGMGMGGMQQMLQQMAAEQQALNQQMQDMFGQGGGAGGTNAGKYSQEQQAGMKKLADNQDRVRKSLEDLANEQKDFGEKPQDRNDAKKLSNELTQLAEELKEITTDINRGNISPETLQRQERILSRLLDATKSINDRDFERKRESKSGTDMLRRSPSGIDLSTQEGKTRAMQELMQSLKKGYTKDYEQIIRQYFEAIQKHY